MACINNKNDHRYLETSAAVASAARKTTLLAVICHPCSQPLKVISISQITHHIGPPASWHSPVIANASHRYSALFVDEDPDVDLGKEGLRHRKDGVSITGSGHVRLRQKQARGGGGGGGGGRGRVGEIGNGRGTWAESSSEGEKEEVGVEGFRVGRRSPSPRKAKVWDVNNGASS